MNVKFDANYAFDNMISTFTPDWIAANGTELDHNAPDINAACDALAAKYELWANRKIDKLVTYIRDHDLGQINAFFGGCSYDKLVVLLMSYLCFSKISCHKWRVSTRKADIHNTLLDIINFYNHS